MTYETANRQIHEMEKDVYYLNAIVIEMLI